MPFSGKRVFGWLTLVLLLLLLAGCGAGEGKDKAHNKPGEGPSANDANLKPVAVAVYAAKRGQAKSIYATTATLEAEHHAEIRARTNGVAIELLAEEGDFVEADQILMRIEDNDQQMNLRQAELVLRQADHEYNRSLKLREAGILPDEQFDQKVNSKDTAQAQLEEARLALSYTRVQAPFSGRVVRRHVQLGANVQSGNVVFEIMDVDPLLAKVYIPSNRLNRVKEGQSLSLVLDSSGQDLDGLVSLISPIVDPSTGTVKITVEVKEYPQGTRPGDFTRVNVVTDLHDNTILVPSIAVFEEQGRNILFVANQGMAERRVVELGFIESGVTEITNGIQEGEQIVIKGQRNLRDGIPIKVLEGGEVINTAQAGTAPEEVGQ